MENTVALQVTAFTIKTGQRNKKFPTHQKVDFVVAVLIICDKYGSYITTSQVTLKCQVSCQVCKRHLINKTEYCIWIFIDHNVVASFINIAIEELTFDLVLNFDSFFKISQTINFHEWLKKIDDFRPWYENFVRSVFGCFCFYLLEADESHKNLFFAFGCFQPVWCKKYWTLETL